MITNLRNYKKALAVTAAVVILAVASVVVLNMTKPYAVYANEGRRSICRKGRR